jgi:hypothetical protein
MLTLAICATPDIPDRSAISRWGRSVVASIFSVAPLQFGSGPPFTRNPNP